MDESTCSKINNKRKNDRESMARRRAAARNLPEGSSDFYCTKCRAAASKKDRIPGKNYCSKHAEKTEKQKEATNIAMRAYRLKNRGKDIKERKNCPSKHTVTVSGPMKPTPVTRQKKKKVKKPVVKSKRYVSKKQGVINDRMALIREKKNK